MWQIVLLARIRWCFIHNILPLNHRRLYLAVPTIKHRVESFHDATALTRWETRKIHCSLASRVTCDMVPNLELCGR